MSRCRKDDFGRREWSRSDRLFEDEMMWYFFTREGTIEGPFRDRCEAHLEFDVYIRAMNSPLLSNCEITQISETDYPAPHW